jgi:hypothetical protein
MIFNQFFTFEYVLDFIPLLLFDLKNYLGSIVQEVSPSKEL